MSLNQRWISKGSPEHNVSVNLIFKAVMIGDDLVSDVGGAQRCGLAGILVRTGKYR